MIAPVTLENDVVRLEPLTLDHVDGLARAAGEERSTFGWTLVPEGLEPMRAYVRAALDQHAAGHSLPFVVRRLDDDVVVGASRYLDVEWFPRSATGAYDVGGTVSRERGPDALEIGSTWYARSAQRTLVNPAAKLLLLAHAFEQWGCVRVSLKTDARNVASRGAMERLGARFEGVRRAHLPATDGTLRDSAYYSILAEEWPEVRAGLLLRLGIAGS